MQPHGRQSALTWALGWIAAVAVMTAAGAVRADIGSDKPAAILVFPKLVVDLGGVTTRGPADTLIRISNTSAEPISMRCFYVDASPQCPNNPAGTCQGSTPTCTVPCLPAWTETDFVVNITARQPIAWVVSQGETDCTDSTPPGTLCFPLTVDGHPGPNGQDNSGSRIPSAPEDPFIGELKCVAVDLNGVPVERNDLKGEAEITRVSSGVVDVEGYNAIGIPAIPETNNGDGTLVLGGAYACVGGAKAQSSCAADSDCPDGACVSAAEYSGCPSVLILDHFFDGADDPVSGAPVTTDLTLIPCTEDFLLQMPVATTVQFLVFNEFEQRISTSRKVTCFDERPISSIDTPDSQRSIFSAANQGTLTGQTRIRGVAIPDPTYGHALLGVAEEFRDGGGSAAFNLHFSGSRPQSDFIYLPVP